jgi:hypothetical protein
MVVTILGNDAAINYRLKQAFHNYLMEASEAALSNIVAAVSEFKIRERQLH